MSTSDFEFRLLGESALLYRSWRKPQPDGTFAEKDLVELYEKADLMSSHLQTLQQLYGESAIGLVVSPRDFPESGQAIFKLKGLDAVSADTLSDPKEHSYATMLNAGIEAARQGIKHVAVVSPSLLKDTTVAARQVMAMAEVYHTWQPGRLAMVGSAINGEHDQELIDRIIAGVEDLTLDNVWRVFPDNSMAFYPKSGLRFSEKTDNNRLGPGLGGSENWDYGLSRILDGFDVALVTYPAMTQGRYKKIDLVGDKVERRKKTYAKIAQDKIDPNGTLDPQEIATIVKNALNKHLFFVQITNRVQIDFTAQQRI